MPNHDLTCPACGLVFHDVYIPTSVGARAYCREAVCAACDGPLVPIPAVGCMSVFSDADSRHGPRDFAKSTVQVEDPGSPTGYRTETIGSLSDIRRIERESEQRARNGEGQTLVFRDYAQDPTNRDVHTLMADPSLRPPKRFTNGQPVTLRRGAAVQADHGSVED